MRSQWPLIESDRLIERVARPWQHVHKSSNPIWSHSSHADEGDPAATQRRLFHRGVLTQGANRLPYNGLHLRLHLLCRGAKALVIGIGVRLRADLARAASVAARRRRSRGASARVQLQSRRLGHAKQATARPAWPCAAASNATPATVRATASACPCSNDDARPPWSLKRASTSRYQLLLPVSHHPSRCDQA